MRTAEASHAVFAATNIAMLLLSLMLGRRTVVSRLTRGRFDNPHDKE